MKLIFAGTPDFAAIQLKALVEAGYEIALVLAQPDRPAGRGQKLQACPVKAYAQSQGLPVFQPAHLKDPGSIEKLKALEPTLMIVSAYGMLLPKTVLDLPEMGCWNVHASLLPRWRGAAPIQSALLHGDQRTGISLMQMDEGLDTGPVLLQEGLDIAPDETSASLHDKLAHLGAKVLLKGLKKAPLTPHAQEADATYAPKIKKEQARIQWDNAAKDIEKQIRAYNPWPVAHTTYQGERIKIWAATVSETEVRSQHAPGEILHVGRTHLEVATGVGHLHITHLQFPNKKPLPLDAILNAKPDLFQTGLRFI